MFRKLFEIWRLKDLRKKILILIIGRSDMSRINNPDTNTFQSPRKLISRELKCHLWIWCVYGADVDVRISPSGLMEYFVCVPLSVSHATAFFCVCFAAKASRTHRPSS